MSQKPKLSGEIVAEANALRQHTQEKIESNRGNRRKYGGKKSKTDKENENDELKKEINMDEHRVPMDELVARLKTNLETGLTESAAKQKFAEDGPNRLTPPKQTPWWVLLIATQTGFFSLLLWFGAILCFIGYGLKNEQENLYLGVVLAAVVTLTGIFSFFQERKSSNLMDSFKNMMPTKTTVIRDGKAADIDAINLVRGDIIKLKAGDKVPADLRIVNCSDDMKVDNASLTGESEPIKRQIKNTHENPLETHNLAFFGTLVPTGKATCLVINCGDHTLMGKIARLSLTTENVETPIAKEIEHFVKIVSTVAVFLGVTFFIIGAALGTDPLTNLVFMIGIIVANVPEGLLATVTVCLTLTAKRMHSKSVLVKNLEGVETLGSTSCICSDKTGTLTQNIMTVAHLVFDQQIWDVESTMATANFNDADPSFRALLRCATVCNTAVWDEGSKKDANGNPVPFQQDVTMGDGSIEHRIMWKPIGDASESAMIKFAQTKIDIMEYRDQVPANRGGTIPFNSANKYQVQIARDNEKGQWVDLVKGAPERVTARCTTILINGEEVPLTPEHLKQIDNLQLQLSRRGMRVLGFAEKVLDKTAYPDDYEFSAEACNFPIGESEQQYAARKEITDAAGEEAPSERMKEGLCYLGMMALIDPPRPQVPPAVAKCKTAGIKVIMVTGDHPETAKAISKKVGIIWGDTSDDIQHRNEEHGLKIGDAGWEDPDMAPAIVVPGWDISVDTPEDVWDDILAHPQVVFARTSPQQKLIIVENCQRRRHVVAVTGDGVNDAPALKKADIGVAMGIMGTDVSKEAADMILLDDNFASIVSGVEEGRLIFDNLKKSIAYTLSSNIPEISPFLAFIVVQIPLPLSTVLILCVDLGTDMVPAISMAWENPEADIMARNPRDADLDRLVTKKLVSFAYLQIGVIQALSGFYTYLVVLNDYGYAPWLLPGLHAVDNWQKLTLYCQVENGAWKNYAGEICPCFNDNSLSENPLCQGLGELWFTSEAANNRFITRCQQMGYSYWDQDATISYVDSNGTPRVTGAGSVSTCAYPMRNIRMTGTPASEPSSDEFSIMNPASYFTDKLFTGVTTLISKPTKLALRGGAECATDPSLVKVDDAEDEQEHCGFYYEYSPYRGVQSQFFERNWGTESVFTSSVIGLGSDTLASVVLTFQPVGTWYPNEASAVAGRNVNAGHISNVVAVSTDEKNKFRTVVTTYASGNLDQTTTLETVLEHSSNKLANEFWDGILPGLAGDDLTRARATLQAKRCQNLCTSQPGFTETLLANNISSTATAQMAADMKVISDANLQPECKEEVFKTFITNFEAGFGRCYDGEENADEMLVANVASRQLQKEALHNAQCASFIGIIIVQWADLVICKTRWLSIREQGMRNQVMNFALVFEVILGSLLCYILPIGIALGTRPLRITHWFTAMPFSIFIFTYDELRKYGMRQTSSIETNKITGRSVRHPGWLERNTYY